MHTSINVLNFRRSTLLVLIFVAIAAYRSPACAQDFLEGSLALTFDNGQGLPMAAPPVPEPPPELCCDQLEVLLPALGGSLQLSSSHPCLAPAPVPITAVRGIANQPRPRVQSLQR